MNYDRLSIYLNDHLAAMTGEVELAGRCLDSNESEPWAAELRLWKTDIQNQVDAMRLMLERINRPESSVKQAFAWLAEKAGRLKLNDSLVEYSPLSRQIELEILLTAARMRQTMWSGLEKFSPQSPLETAVDYRKFHDQAERQVKAMQELCEINVIDAFGEQVVQ